MNIESSGRSRARFLSALRCGVNATTNNTIRQTAGSGDSDIGTGTPGISFTVVMLVNPASLNSGRRLWTRAAAVDHTISVSGTLGALAFSVGRATTADSYTTTTVPLKVNNWLWLAFVRDVSATNLCSAFFGELGSPFVADTGGTIVNGSGALSTDVGLLTTIGNSKSATPSSGFPGLIAFFGRYNRALSVNELRQVQFGLLDGNIPKIPNCIELLNIGDRGHNRKILNYGINQSFDYTTTGVFSAQTNIPIPFISANLRRIKYKAPTAGAAVIPRRTLMGIGV